MIDLDDSTPEDPDGPHVVDAAMGIVKIWVCVPKTWSNEQIIGYADSEVCPPTQFGFTSIEPPETREVCPDRSDFWHVVVAC